MSEEIEPVAWLVSQEPLSSVQYVTDEKPLGLDDKRVFPLYTKEQLQSRVKMTQAEFDEFQKLVEQEYDLYSAISEIGDTNLCPNLYDRLFGSVDNKSKQNEFAVLWANFEEFEPQKTIEIIPEKKWFVRLIPTIPTGDDDIYLDSERIVSPDYHSPKKAAATFDTKEQADEWTNPLTESVLLPVGDE
ncbi:hypothetical protein [Leuconostoc gasicomitatum]|uniref:hypothetical protein n=1 Tax=Leuconostoc gasicomitatum TaxID=115778 RepID=UPI0007E236FC|nr:hypothetical protein [Leuconostoc gasicomitatum]CUW06699.1 hypothetical protein PB1E_0738 [Leuconostoc gasicomitatum]